MILGMYAYRIHLEIQYIPKLVLTYSRITKAFTDIEYPCCMTRTGFRITMFGLHRLDTGLLSYLYVYI